MLPLLELDVRGEQLAQLLDVLLAPRERFVERLGERLLRVDHARIDGEAGRLLGKAPLDLGEAEIVAHDVERIGRVRAIEHGERGIEPDVERVQPQETIGDGVERAGPARLRDRPAAARGRARQDPLRAQRHLRRRAPAEGEQQDAPRIGAAEDEVRHAMCQRVGLARAGAGDDEQRPASVHDGVALRRIERVEVVRHPSTVRRD